MNFRKILIKLSVITSTLIFISVSISHAVQINSVLMENTDGELDKVSIFTCSKADSFCQQLCGSTDTCEIPEVLCVDCVSFRNPDLRSMMTETSVLFRAESGVVPTEQLVAFFRDHKYILFESDIFLNVFNRQKASLIKATYNSFCPESSENPMMLAKITDDFELEKFVAVICQDKNKEAYAVPIKWNPEFMANAKAYFDSAKQVLAIESLRLKLDSELPEPLRKMKHHRRHKNTSRKSKHPSAKKMTEVLSKPPVNLQITNEP